MIRWAESQALFSSLGCPVVRSRVSLYVDDVVLFVVPRQQDLAAVKAILDIFANASGLSTNMEKSTTMPICCSDEQIMAASQWLACAVDSFPSIYLGVPLSMHRLRRSEEQFIIDKITARIPTWKGNLVNMAGRTTLVSSTLSAIPMHLSIAMCLS